MHSETVLSTKHGVTTSREMYYVVQLVEDTVIMHGGVVLSLLYIGKRLSSDSSEGEYW